MDHAERYLSRKGMQSTAAGSGREQIAGLTILLTDGTYRVYTDNEPWNIRLVVTDKVDYDTFEKLMDLLIETTRLD